MRVHGDMVPLDEFNRVNVIPEPCTHRLRVAKFAGWWLCFFLCFVRGGWVLFAISLDRGKAKHSHFWFLNNRTPKASLSFPVTEEA